MVKMIIFYHLIIIPWMNLIQTSITPHKKELTKSIHEIIHHDCVLIIRTSIMSEKNVYFDSQAAHIFNVVNRKKKKKPLANYTSTSSMVTYTGNTLPMFHEAMEVIMASGCLYLSVKGAKLAI